MTTHNNPALALVKQKVAEQKARAAEQEAERQASHLRDCAVFKPVLDIWLGLRDMPALLPGRGEYRPLSDRARVQTDTRLEVVCDEGRDERTWRLWSEDGQLLLLRGCAVLPCPITTDAAIDLVVEYAAKHLILPDD